MRSSRVGVPSLLVVDFAEMHMGICVEYKEQSEDGCFDYGKAGSRESSEKVVEGG